MNYDADTLAQINKNADLLSYASEFFELEKRGDDFYAHCPFHTDKTASLSFNPSANLYHCFSCGRSGGAIKFFMDFEGMKFDDAVKKAASLAKIDLGKICRSETIMFLKTIRNSRKAPAARYSHPVIPRSDLNKYKRGRVAEWLDEGIEQSVMDLFGVRIDEYNNRIVYPVYDASGNLINIKGRTRYQNYKALRLPKYINYYKVGVMDYFQGLNITLPYIKESGEVIVFESLKSVMKVYGWGYKNAVSAEKHSLTREQTDILIRLGVSVVLAWDSDVDYRVPEVRKNLDILRRLTNVYIMTDPRRLLGGAAAKNSPADCGREIWEELYRTKRKVV